MKIKGLIFDFGFTLFHFKDVSVEKYLNCYREGLTKSLEKLYDLKMLTNINLRDEISKTFQKKRAEYFKEYKN